MAAEWVNDIRDQCQKAGVAFHFKQWGVCSKRNGRLLEGRTWDEMPALPVELFASRPPAGHVQLPGRKLPRHPTPAAALTGHV
jgi:hypothetical protein